jgi:D-lactate dehydrogenase
MKHILFFDTDNLLKDFLQNKKIPNYQFIFFDKDINSLSNTEIDTYLDSPIISVFTHSSVIDNKQLDKFKNLRLITTRSTGYNHIDLEYCKKRDITVCNVPKYGETTVAEFAFGLLLALARKIIQGRNGMIHNHVEISNYMGFDLYGKTIGIIGTGSIGQHMIQLAQGFGMKVIAYDHYPTPSLKDLYVPTIKNIFKQADIISLHIPSTPQNHHMLDETAFRMMKRGVIIINTARGDLIDTQALYCAIRSGIVGGAGLDVLENEDFLIHDDVLTCPRSTDRDMLLDSAMNLKLLQFHNVIATPHIAFNSIDAINRINDTTFDNIIAFLKGKAINRIF